MTDHPFSNGPESSDDGSDDWDAAGALAEEVRDQLRGDIWDLLGAIEDPDQEAFIDGTHELDVETRHGVHVVHGRTVEWTVQTPDGIYHITKQTDE